MQLQTQQTERSFRLPTWLIADIERGAVPQCLTTEEQQMAYAIELSQRNVAEGTGGPFGSVIVDSHGLVMSVGVNLVVSGQCSILHGEMVAIMMAQGGDAGHDLGAPGLNERTLITSAAPCAMCVGGIVWSGVRKVITGATSFDVERLTGFDEGPIHPQWAIEFKNRGIVVVQEVLRQAACAALQFYVDNGGFIYNGRKGTCATVDESKELSPIS